MAERGREGVGEFDVRQLVPAQERLYLWLLSAAGRAAAESEAA
jgi:hypothetical protein